MSFDTRPGSHGSRQPNGRFLPGTYLLRAGPSAVDVPYHASVELT